MKNIKYIFLFSFLSAISLYSCKKDKPTETTQDFGYNYFPDEVGNYIIYTVDSIHYDDAGNFPHDTTRYLLMEKNESIFYDNTNRPTVRMERYKKYYNDSIPYDAMQWVLTDVWTANKTTTTLEKKEENIIFLKLIFPVKLGKIWNGNSYNSLSPQDYEIISADQPDIMNSISFDSVEIGRAHV